MDLNIDISVITPAYNAEKFITRTYNSLKNQKIKNFEWIIINDHSNDGTEELIKKFIIEAHLKIILVNNFENVGVAESRNKGLDLASGKYICFLDADDFWLEEKLLLQFQYMNEHKCSISYMDYRHVDDKGKFIKNIIPPIECNRNSLLKSNCIGTLTCMVSKELIKNSRFIKHGHEDYIFWLELLSSTEKAIKVITKKPLCNYTISTESLSGNKIKSAQWQWKVYRNILKISLLKSCYYFSHYAIKAFIKHKL
ncbi:glycosyltransferase family 2 protein [Acinetobacter sp. BSP-28]|uniref:glycosyltransferase family 2 protein n=1 Tax=Acinetobacter sp. BSP-28 TaxID=3344661 RepID=UPI0037703A3E